MDSLKRFPKLLPNRLLSGRYRVIQQLGAGGFSQTFLAKDTQLPGQPLCVVKQLQPQIRNMARWQVAKRLFDTEATVLYRLGDHDQIPRLLAHFEDNKEFFLVQEFIEGESLDKPELLRWTEGQALQRLHDILGVLSFVHQQRVIHRDIKPSNLIRRYKDDKLVLIDFGAVKQVSTPLNEALVDDSLFEQATISIGTQGYMPPEQVSGNPRYNSDLYAVGMIGIQALTGARPNQLPRDPQTGEILWQALNPSVSAAFAEILDRMVRYHFKDRYQTVDEPLRAIAQLIAERGECPDEELKGTEDLATTIAGWNPEQETDEETEVEAMPSSSADRIVAPFVSTVEPFATAVEDAAESRFAAEPVSSASGNLAGSRQSRSSFPLQALPNLPPLPSSVFPVSAAAPKAPTRTEFHIPRWLLLPVGGVIAAVTALSSHLTPDRLQSTLPASTAPGQQSSTQAAVIPSLPCREPAPPPLSSGKPNHEYTDGTRYYGPMGTADRPADGRGTMVFPTGNRYDGEFRNGSREGCGTYSFTNGRRYIGQFKADRFEGLGIWLLGDGNRYVGAFQNNRCHGEGVFLFKDGRSKRGTWENGKLINGNLSCDR